DLYKDLWLPAQLCSQLPIMVARRSVATRASHLLEHQTNQSIKISSLPLWSLMCGATENVYVVPYRDSVA
ncbi:hypothetical protein K0M31_006616, partial [Melipona bicolor]